MKRRDSVLAAGLAAVLALTAACEDPYEVDSRDSYSGPAVPDVAGEWKGCHYIRRGGRNVGQTSVTATIFQNEADRTRVTVVTSLHGMGQFLSGTIDASGFMFLIDLFDGEDWTTHYRNATPDFIEIDDYLMVNNVITGVNVVYLNERLTSAGPRHSDRLSFY
ncbi:MAG: hypothetical protein FJ225_08285 [Lentisphaerae bacterium]|nr:hypothetical protein [Lentisphaerota bacterium]